MKRCPYPCCSFAARTVALLVTTQLLFAGHPVPGPKYPGEYRQANMHLLRFQEALAKGQWQDALALCSQRVQAKAAEWPSPETFFRDTMPLDKLLLQDFGCWSCGSNNYGLFIDLTLPKAQPVIQWFYAIYHTNNAWVVDYPPVKVADYMAQKKAAIQAREDKLNAIRRSLEPQVRTLKTHLSPVSEKFVIGSPMLFKLELLNFGTTSVHYQNSGVAFHPLTVLDQAMQPVPAHEEPLQIMVRHGEVAAGKSAIVADKIDIAKNHQMTKPGKYFVQFSGKDLHIGQPLPPQEPGRFGEDPGFWPSSFVAVAAQFPSEIIEIEVVGAP